MLPAFEKSVYVKCVYSVRKITLFIMFTRDGSKFQTDDGICPTGSDCPFEFCHHVFRPFNQLQRVEIYVKASKSSLHSFGVCMKCRGIDEFLSVCWKITPFAESFSLSAHQPSRNSVFLLEMLRLCPPSFLQSAEKH